MFRFGFLFAIASKTIAKKNVLGGPHSIKQVHYPRRLHDERHEHTRLVGIHGRSIFFHLI